jgi:hypothetical protein
MSPVPVSLLLMTSDFVRPFCHVREICAGRRERSASAESLLTSKLTDDLANFEGESARKDCDRGLAMTLPVPYAVNELDNLWMQICRGKDTQVGQARPFGRQDESQARLQTLRVSRRARTATEASQ